MRRSLAAIALLIASCHDPRPAAHPHAQPSATPSASAPSVFKASSASGQCVDSPEPRRHELETVDDTLVLRLYADGFVDLSPRERVLAYWLSQAAIAGEPITWDQRSRHGLALKELFEELVLHAGAIDPSARPKVEVFARKLFLNKGIYDGWTQKKLVPPFTREELKAASQAAWKDGAKLPSVTDEASLGKLLASLDKVLFDPGYEPMGVDKSPPKGKDLITASAANYYEGLTLKDVASYKETHPLNSKLVKRGGKIEEVVYRAKGDGLYATQLGKVVEALRQALPHAQEGQRKNLEALVEFLETGEHEAYRRHAIGWVKDTSTVDLILGFVEQYGDPRGVHGEYEAAVFAVDRSRSAMMQKVAAEAGYFERRMPWLDAYKRTEFKPPVASAVLPLTLAGGAGPVTPVGINLPNDQDIRQLHGSKNFYLTSVEAAATAAHGKVLTQHLLLPAHRAEYERCASSAYAASVALHEITGHGSGKVNPKLVGDPLAALREYGSTLEEARADLVALHASWDPKAFEIGLLPDEGCARAMATAYPARMLMRWRMVPTGDALHEDHMRAQALIVRYAVERGAVREQQVDGRWFLAVTDVDLWRKAVADLLAEIMRIKAEGDYARARELVEKHGAKLVPGWRDHVVTRLKEAGVPPRHAFLSPRIRPLKDSEGRIVDATILDSLGLVDTVLLDAGKKRAP